MTLAIALLLYTNALRQQPLIENDILHTRAQARAEQLCAEGQWSHAGFTDSFRGLNYRYAGENLAKGYLGAQGKPDPAAVAMAWSTSAVHYRNLTNTHYAYMGLGQACDITVQLFSDSI